MRMCSSLIRLPCCFGLSALLGRQSNWTFAGKWGQLIKTAPRNEKASPGAGIPGEALVDSLNTPTQGNPEIGVVSRVIGGYAVNSIAILSETLYNSSPNCKRRIGRFNSYRENPITNYLVFSRHFAPLPIKIVIFGTDSRYIPPRSDLHVREILGITVGGPAPVRHT